jgi:hypothetical protein
MEYESIMVFRARAGVAAAMTLIVRCNPCTSPAPAPSSDAFHYDGDVVVPSQRAVADAPIEVADAASLVALTTPSAEPIDVTAWREKHKLEGHVVGACNEVTAGVPPEPSLLCRTTGETSDKRLTTARLYVPTGGRLAEAWTGVVGTAWVQFVVELSVDGSSLVVRDERARGCDGAYEEAYAKAGDNMMPDWLWDEIQRGCAGRGTYVWSKGRYLRDRDASAAGPFVPRRVLDGGVIIVGDW